MQVLEGKTAESTERRKHMHAKRIVSVALAALLMIAACGGGSDYSDAVKVNTKFVDAMSSYLDGIDKADSASAVVDAIDAYAREMEKLAPEMKAIAAKHPDWKDISKVPEELKPIQEKATAMAARIPASFMKSMKFMMDPKVQEAHKRLQEAMTKMQ
jgi:hypothetical protein